METDMFDELLQSLEEAVAIKNGEIPASRITHYTAEEVSALRDSED